MSRVLSRRVRVAIELTREFAPAEPDEYRFEERQRLVTDYLDGWIDDDGYVTVDVKRKYGPFPIMDAKVRA